MSKNQEPETPEPEYQEPEYKSTIGEKEKALNNDALEQLMNQAKNKNKKGKKNRKEHQNENKNQEKKKKIIIEDPNDLKKYTSQFSNAPQRTASQKETEGESLQQISQANYKNTAILATVSGQIEETDVTRFFNGLQIFKIHTKPGYFIIEFQTEEDLHKALQKNKTPYKNNIMVLVGEYSIEDEDPKPEKHDFPRSYPRYSRYKDDDYDEDDYAPPPPSKFVLGQKLQLPQQQQQQQPLPPQSQSDSSRPSAQKKSFFALGSKQQSAQQPEQPKTNAPYRTGTYKPPYKANLQKGKQENLNQIETSNSFDILKEDE